jgi:hypothetical protein
MVLARSQRVGLHITTTTNAASKTYDDPDPSPLTTGSGSGFLPVDGMSATVSGATRHARRRCGPDWRAGPCARADN